MKKIDNFMLPQHTNQLYTKEAISSVSLTRDIAGKINEIIDTLNELNETDLTWKHEQEGTIRKAVLYMKDNLLNTLHELLSIYDNDSLKNAMIELYGKELNDLKVIVTPQMFGAVGDGVTNDINAIEEAISSLTEGSVLYFPAGTYLMTGRAVNVSVANVAFAGEGKILCDYGFRLHESNFKAIGLSMASTGYSQECRAFMIDKFNTLSGTSAYVENFTFKDCYFENFFYSVCAIGGAYNFDGTELTKGYPIRDIIIENCYSDTYRDQNAGHFQCIQIENVSYINNRTYGGKNASSYNAIKGNGFIRVLGNYDNDNSHASCEIENGSNHVVIGNNTFWSKIWVDDSSDVVVTGNVVDDGILISVGSDVGDAKNVIVSNNTCDNIRCERYGEYQGGIIENVNIIGNTIKGTNTHGIWVHGNAAKKAKINNNIISGANTNDISIQRSSQLECYIHNNFGNGNTLLIAGSDGKVYVVDNYNFTVSGNRDSLPTSHLERSFNGVKVTDTDGIAWRVNVNTDGGLYATKY